MFFSSMDKLTSPSCCDLLHSINTPSTAPEIFSKVEKHARELGFDYCAYVFHHVIPLTKPRIASETNYPLAWCERYKSNGYLTIDPTIARAQASQLPFTWSESLFDRTRPFWEEAKGHGLAIGWAKSIFDNCGSRGMLTLARPNEALEPTELETKELKMKLLSYCAHMALSRVYHREMMVSIDKLSMREVEVLKWHADGKTAEEIGMILNISTDTVKFHTKNAVTKLGTSNKTAAVVRAAIMGLLA